MSDIFLDDDWLKHSEHLLKSGKFPQRDDALARLGAYQIVQIHDDGDLTVSSEGKLYVVTADGELFQKVIGL